MKNIALTKVLKEDKFYFKLLTLEIKYLNKYQYRKSNALQAEYRICCIKPNNKATDNKKTSTKTNLKSVPFRIPFRIKRLSKDFCFENSISKFHLKKKITNN